MHDTYLKMIGENTHMCKEGELCSSQLWRYRVLFWETAQAEMVAYGGFCAGAWYSAIGAVLTVRVPLQAYK